MQPRAPVLRSSLALSSLLVAGWSVVPLEGCHLVLGQFEVPPPVGDPCQEDADCGGGDNTCIQQFSCTHDCTVASDCVGQLPGGFNSGGTPNVCVSISTYDGERTRCAAGCASAGDCERFGTGFGCVPYVGADPSTPGACYRPDLLGNGDPCGGTGCESYVCLGGDLFCTDDCQTTAGCSGMFVGGLNVFEGSNACVDLGASYGQKCVPSCSSTQDCVTRYASPGLVCVTGPDVGGVTVSVCVPAS